MHREFLICDSVYFYLFTMAKCLGLDVFSDIEYTSCVQLNKDFVDQLVPSKKIVIAPSWNYSPADFSWADLVIACSSELFTDDIKSYDAICKAYNNANVIIITPGIVKGENNIPHSKILVEPSYWFNKVESGNVPVTYDMNTRPYKFDALLGTKKKHRAKVFQYLEKLHLLECSLVNIQDHYVQDFPLCQSYSSPALLELELDRVRDFKQNAKTTLEAYSAQGLIGINDNVTGEIVSMSCAVPELIYKNSWFSIVCESNFYNNVSFITEKTAKAFYAMRVFVLISSMGALAELHMLGFKTFGDVIDESYDSIADVDERIAAAMQQVVMLANSDPVKVYDTLKTVLEHNAALMATFPVASSKRIKEFLTPHLNQLSQS
jgi:hypothetical protein